MDIGKCECQGHICAFPPAVWSCLCRVHNSYPCYIVTGSPHSDSPRLFPGFLFYLVLLDFLCWNSFRFTAKVSGKSECSHTWTTSSTTGILHYSGPFAPINEPTLTHHYYPKSIVSFRVHFGLVHSMAFHNCVTTCIHPCSITEYRFTLKILCASPVHPSLIPGNHWSYFLHNFAFSKMSYSWNLYRI